MPLDLDLLPDKPQTALRGGFSLDLDSLPDKPGEAPDIHWIGETIKGTIADITSIPFLAVGVRSPSTGAISEKIEPYTETLGKWLNEPVGHQKESFPNKTVFPWTDPKTVKFEERDMPITRGKALAEAGVNLVAIGVLGKIGFDELRNVIQSPQVQLGLNRLVTEGRGIVWRAQKMAGMQPPSALVPVEDTQIAKAVSEGKISLAEATRASSSFKQSQEALRRTGTPESLAREAEVKKLFPSAQVVEEPIAEVKLDISKLPDKPIPPSVSTPTGEGKVLFKGIGGEQPNINQFAYGTHYADNPELAYEYARTKTPQDIRAVRIKPEAKIIDLEEIKLQYAQEMKMADPKVITEKLIAEGYDIAKAKMPDGQYEYIVLNEKAVEPLYKPKATNKQLLASEPYDTQAIKDAQKMAAEQLAQGKKDLANVALGRVKALRGDILKEQALSQPTGEGKVAGIELSKLINNPSRLSMDERLNLPQSQVKKAEKEGELLLKHIKEGGADKADIFFRSTHKEDFSERADAGIFFANDFGTSKHYAGNLFKTESSKMQVAKLDIKKPYYATKDEIEYHAGKRQEWVKKLKSEGYDAIVEKASDNPNDMGYDVIPTEVAVFDKSQVKEIAVIDNPEGRNLSDKDLYERIKSKLSPPTGEAKGKVEPEIQPLTISDFNQEKSPLPPEEIKMNPVAIDKANEIQNLLGKKLVISSGYRTEKYNQDLIKRGYKADLKSVHLSGNAFDVDYKKSGLSQQEIVDAAIKTGMNVEDITLTPNHVHIELPTEGSPTKLYKTGEGKPKPRKYVEVNLSDEDKVILEQIKHDITGAQPGHKYVTRDEISGEVVKTGYEPSDYSYIPYWPHGWSAEPVNTIINNAINTGKLTEKQDADLKTLLSIYKEVANEQVGLEQELATEGVSQSEIDEAKRAGEEEAHSVVEPGEGDITPPGKIREELHPPEKKDLFQEEGELFAQAKAQKGGKTFAMPPGGMEEWIKRTQEQNIQLKPLEMPELVKLAVELMNKYPVVKKLVTNLGLFKFGKGIALDVKIFKDPNIAGIVLAHEIGHLIDWLPDYTLSRGNILGRIATLRNYMKSLLGEKPGTEGTVLTLKDRERLRKTAAQELKAESKLGEREIIEEIIKEIPIYAESKITPDEILSIWREQATSIRETNPTLYNFISGLSSAEKKSIIKQAMQGVIDERILQMQGGKRIGTKIVKEQVRRVIKPEEITPHAISKRFKELLRKEIIKRKLFSREIITDELKKVTQWWNPFDDTKKGQYTSYRYGSDELYAEAISVLLNKPEKLEELAPQFYKAFWNYIDRKPEVKKALLELQDFLNMGEGEKLRVRQQDIYSMFKKGEELFYDKRKEYELRQKSLWFKLRSELIDKNTAVLDKIKQAEKMGKIINPEDNPGYYLEEYNYIGGKIKNLLGNIDDVVITPLAKQGITQENIGEYLFLNRVVTERAEIANPLGHNRDTAQRQLEYLKTLLGNDKFSLLKQSVDKFQSIMKELLLEAEKVGLYKPEVIQELITNPAYATFQVLDYLDDYVAPSIINQIGTLKPIANPFASTILKMISTVRMIERIKTNNSIIDFMNLNFSNEIEKAKVKHISKYKSEIPEKEGFEIIKTREGGKLAGYYVDPYIAQSVNSAPRNINNAVISVLRFLNSSYFRPVYVNLNLGFQTFNAIRDFTRAWKLNPNVNFVTHMGHYWKALPIAKQRIWGNFSSPVIKEMQQSGMLSFTYNNLMRGVSEGEETQIEFLLRQYDILKKNPQNPVMKIFNFIEELGDFIETVPKVAGYLSRLKSKQNIKEIAHQVRVFSGSPDFLRKGAGYDWYNNAFLFSNAIKEGIRGDVEGAFTNPKTRSGYWWRTTKVNFLPKILALLATLGFFGQRIKENFDKQTEYDKTNYTTIPLGLTEEGKAVYLRVPQDEMGRLLGGIFWKGMSGVINKELKSVQDIGGLLGGQIPSMAPEIELLSSWAQYLTGKNPYDWFKGREVLSDDEKMAGGWYSLKPMLTWTAGKMGIYGATIKAQNDETTWEKIIKFTPILQRFLRITDYGEIEKEREEKQERYKSRAIRSLEKRELRR